jgi:catechol 2,3-dioxygenase-like lactoylglutathione lyase family enzyme
MTRIDPIITVKDVSKSCDWYERIFGFRRVHGGNEFAVLVNDKEQIVLCLHAWGEHQHPTLNSPSAATSNGLLLYLHTTDLTGILHRVSENGIRLALGLERNDRSLKNEFSLYDPDGYFITVTEYHTYEG